MPEADMEALNDSCVKEGVHRLDDQNNLKKTCRKLRNKRTGKTVSQRRAEV